MRSVTRKTPVHDSNSKTADLVVTTLEHLLTEGENFTSLSIEQLAKKSGIARATFYLHFRNKGELVGHLMKRVGREMRSAAKASMAELAQPERKDFLRFMQQAIEVNYQHRAAIRAVLETISYDPAVAHIYAEFMQQMIGDTRHFIARLQASGRARTDIAPDMAEVLTWMAERCCHQMLSNGNSAAERGHLAEMLTHVVWSAIAAPA